MHRTHVLLGHQCSLTRFQYACLQGEPNEVCACLYIQLVSYARSIGFDRLHAQPQAFGDLSLPASARRPLSLFASADSNGERNVLVMLNQSPDEQLEVASEYFNRELEYRIKTFTTLFEPIMIVFVGLIVGFVAIALVSAMYGVLGGVQDANA